MSLKPLVAGLLSTITWRVLRRLVYSITLLPPASVCSRRLAKTDAPQTQKKIEELGGKLLSGKEPEGEDGFYMYVSDIAGNRFGIYECKKSG
jgi:hypothetical protein